jgi:hypothetical protein
MRFEMSKFSVADVAYLAGIIEGEGTVSFQAHIKRDGLLRITPYVCVVNSDEGILNHCWELMNGLCEGSTNAFPRWCITKLKTSEASFQGKLVCKNLRLDGVATRLVIDEILPYMKSVKKQYAENILRYIALREKEGLIRNAKGQIIRAGYTWAQLELVAGCRKWARATTLERMKECPNVFESIELIPT